MPAPTHQTEATHSSERLPASGTLRTPTVRAGGSAIAEILALQRAAGNQRLGAVLPAGARVQRPSSVRDVVAEPGSELDAASRAHFQSTFGYDLSGVRLHTNERAQASAAALSARAYTVGSHIVLGRGEYAPESPRGRYVLAHELAHVIQQSRGGPGAPPAGQRSVETAAGTAAEAAARGQSVAVSGASALGIARLSLFDEFSGGAYSWPLLKLALTHTRPVSTIISDINSLSSADRDQALKDITAERTETGRRLADLLAKRDAQTDPELRKIFKPMLEATFDIARREDEVLDGVFGTIAGSETRASLLSGTVAPTAAEKPLIESALKPDLRRTSTGAVEPFHKDIPGDPKNYLKKLQDTTPPLINDHFQQQVVGRGEAEHKDPTKVHALSELERIGNASKAETDKVFGAYKTGPSLKADTKTTRGNIHDLWADTQKRLKAMTPTARREMARQLVFYFFQSDDEILAINKLHNADPKFSATGAPTNEEATYQKQVVDDNTATDAQVQKLNEIDRGWDASASRGQVNVQVFKPPDQTSGPLAGPNVADRDFLWDMFQTLIHEYLHTLAHAKYNAYAETFGDTSNTFNTLVEGVDSLLDEIVWSAVEPHVNDQSLRDQVEGPGYSSLPPIKVIPASRRRYPSYAQAIKFVNIVGIRNLYAAYFLGDVKKIGA